MDKVLFLLVFDFFGVCFAVDKDAIYEEREGPLGPQTMNSWHSPVHAIPRLLLCAKCKFKQNQNKSKQIRRQNAF